MAIAIAFALWLFWGADASLNRTKLASALHMLGRHAESEMILRGVVKQNTKKLGDKHPNTFGSRDRLVYLLRVQGKHDKAEAECRELIKLRDTTLVPTY